MGVGDGVVAVGDGIVTGGEDGPEHPTDTKLTTISAAHPSLPSARRLLTTAHLVLGRMQARGTRRIARMVIRR